MLNAFKTFIQQENLLQKNHPILLGVSGGIDSVVLADLFFRAGFPFGIAHCNFKLRAGADKDEAFVRSLAQKKYKVNFWSTSFDTEKKAQKEGQSIQMVARQLRYRWLEEIRLKEGFHCIATAHHQDDIVETMLLNLTKGTGIAGLHGILPKQELAIGDVQPKLIRPLLFTSKEVIQKYAEKRKLDYREDPTNTSTQYERNKLRHKVVPVLKSINPNLAETFWQNSLRLRDVETLYRHNINRFKKKLVEQHGVELYINYHKLRLYPASKTLLYEILKEFCFNFKEVEQLYSNLDRPAGKQFFSNTHRVVKDRQYLVVAPKKTKKATNLLIKKDRKRVSMDSLKLRFSLVTNPHFKIPKRKEVACLDYDKLSFPLQLRLWRAGDYFYPLGMHRNKKKIKNFLTDEKVSIIEKERTWVLLSGKKIIWVVGYRIDERFKVTTKTERIYKVKAKFKLNKD